MDATCFPSQRRALLRILPACLFLLVAGISCNQEDQAVDKAPSSPPATEKPPVVVTTPAPPVTQPAADPAPTHTFDPPAKSFGIASDETVRAPAADPSHSPAPAAPATSVGIKPAAAIASLEKSGPRSFRCEFSLGEDEEHPEANRNAEIAGFGNGVFKAGNGYTMVKVFYGTDRARFDYHTVSHAAFLPVFATLSAMATVLLGIGAAISIRGRRWLGFATSTCFVLTVIFSGLSWLNPLPPPVLAGRPLPVRYTGERGEMELGVCEIGVPQDHTMGHVETPSFFKFEMTEDPSEHVRVKKVTTRTQEEFYADLHSTVGRSPRKEIMVFVHGYNVSFTDAARRTAQIAYDLEFQGAPVFFSWPSQNGLLSYTVDENNVSWATPHLKHFLLDIARKSEADAIHLIAHSMGNRALTGALRELALEYRDDARFFNQVVLAAPDVDAEIFKRDIAPQITRTAERVTLYASSNDRALKASKRLHGGYPRAGESGKLLVIAPGIETIDVSALDTSFLGHSYYGDSDSIIADMHHLFHTVRSARERAWLSAIQRGGQTYWEFNQKVSIARRNTPLGSDSHDHR